MRKHKLLMPIIAGVSAIGVTTSMFGIMTGCSCHKKVKHIEAGNINLNIIGNDYEGELHFTLTQKLPNNCKLVSSLDDQGKFSFEQPVVTDKLVTISVKYCLKVVDKTVNWKGKIDFKCVNKTNDKVIWSQSISDATVTYSPYLIMNVKEAISSDVSDKKLKATFDFFLAEDFDSDKYDLNPCVHTESYTQDYTVSCESMQVSEESNRKLVLTIVGETKNSSVCIGDSFLFDFQLECLKKDSIETAWQSNMFKKIKVTCFEKEKEIPREAMDLKKPNADDEYWTLKGIDIDKLDDDLASYNTLVIPADVVAITGDYNDQPIGGLGLTGVSKIVIPENSVLTTVSPYALNGFSQIKFLDVSSLSDDVQGLDTIKLGDYSFSNWSSSGTIIWGENFSYYKRHMITEDLYKAGLYSPKWYNISEVNTLSDLKEACDMGESIKLMKDIEIPKGDDYTGQIDIANSLVLDLNGHSVSCEAPIYNWYTKDFAIFGVWDCEVVVTDTSENHNGSIETFDQSENLPGTVGYPTPLKSSNDAWEWIEEENRYRPRETRCFYIRSDIPTRAQATLDVLAGTLKGNCTTIMNWNTKCWIEDIYSTEDHDYAPTFDIFSPYFVPPPLISTEWNPHVTDPVGEIINCDDGTLNYAEFIVCGGKFMAKKGNAIDSPYYYYDPSNAEHDNPSKPENWVASGYKVIKNETDHYTRVVPNVIPV